jgi:hypothetical protein
MQTGRGRAIVAPLALGTPVEGSIAKVTIESER